MLRLAKNFTARRNYLRDTTGQRGKPPTKGDLVRPLARTYKGKELAAAAADATFSWQLETGETVNTGVRFFVMDAGIQTIPASLDWLFMSTNLAESRDLREAIENDRFMCLQTYVITTGFKMAFIG